MNRLCSHAAWAAPASEDRGYRISTHGSLTLDLERRAITSRIEPPPGP